MLQISERVRIFNRLLVHATAASAHSYSWQSAFVKAVMFGFWNFVYSFNYPAAARKACETMSEAKFDRAQAKFLWNLPESPGRCVGCWCRMSNFLFRG